MALYFLDTSALVKLYVREAGTDALLSLAARNSEVEFSILSLSSVEFRSAIRRRQRAGDIGDTTADQILGLFQSHAEHRFITQPMTEILITSAAALIDRHFLRAYDALQLSGCLGLASTRSECIFTCSDDVLVEAARSEGLSTFNPSRESR